MLPCLGRVENIRQMCAAVGWDVWDVFPFLRLHPHLPKGECCKEVQPVDLSFGGGLGRWEGLFFGGIFFFEGFHQVALAVAVFFRPGLVDAEAGFDFSLPDFIGAPQQQLPRRAGEDEDA